MLIDGSSKGYFRCFKGVRKGEPLSLFFCLDKNFLSRYLAHLIDSDSLVPIFSPVGMLLLHILYILMKCCSFVELLLKTFRWFWMPLSFMDPSRVSM